ncbi:MAG TPA: Yip1 family protein [Candidatus Acidoferrales bacterium]|nr:Yip1 family protein [Candidatus Acidoferrales bacterium]
MTDFGGGPQPAGMGELPRIIGVFFEPAKAFEDVARRPGFLTPLLLILVANLVYYALYSQHVGWERLVRHQIEASSRGSQLTPEEREQNVQIGAKAGPLLPAFLLAGVPLGYLICGAVLLRMVKRKSATVTFKQVFAVMCYSAIPDLLFVALAIVVMFLKSPDDFDIRNPLPSNPGALMDPNTKSYFLHTLANSLDLFSAWKIILIALGLKAAAGKSLSFTGALLAGVYC